MQSLGGEGFVGALPSPSGLACGVVVLWRCKRRRGGSETARVVVIRFPDGSKEFSFPDSMLEPGDVVWHDGERYLIDSITWDGIRGVATTTGPDVEAHIEETPVPPPPTRPEPS